METFQYKYVFFRVDTGFCTYNTTLQKLLETARASGKEALKAGGSEE